MALWLDNSGAIIVDQDCKPIVCDDCPDNEWENCPPTAQVTIAGVANDRSENGSCTGCGGYNTTATLVAGTSIGECTCFYCYVDDEDGFCDGYLWACYPTGEPNNPHTKYVCIHRVPESSPGAGDGYYDVSTSIPLGCNWPSGPFTSKTYDGQILFLGRFSGSGRVPKGKTHRIYPVSVPSTYHCCDLSNAYAEVVT